MEPVWERNSHFRVYFKINTGDRDAGNYDFPLGQENRFFRDLARLKCFQNDLLVAYDGQKVHNLNDNQFQHILNNKRLGTDAYIDVIKNPTDDFMDTFRKNHKIPKVTPPIIALCHVCPLGSEYTYLKDTKNISGWSRHTESRHVPTIQHHCDICNKDFARAIVLTEHREKIHGFYFDLNESGMKHIL